MNMNLVIPVVVDVFVYVIASHKPSFFKAKVIILHFVKPRPQPVLDQFLSF